MELTPNSEYDNCIKRLVARVKQIHEAENSNEWSPTESKKAIEAIAKTLDQVVNILEADGTAQFDIENLHDARGVETVVGIDGFLVESTNDDWTSYKAMIWKIRDLSESARFAMEEIPNPRKKRALEFAARGFLHIRSQYGFNRPALSDNGPDVTALKEVCEAAGIFLSLTRYRGVLSKSLESFDPYYFEPGMDKVLGYS